MTIRAVIFSSIGTLVDMASTSEHYVDLIKAASEQGVHLDMKSFYTQVDSFPKAILKDNEQAAEAMEHIKLKSEQAALYPDVMASLAHLENMGIEVIVCANTTDAQGSATRKLMPAGTGFVFSHEYGVMKPDHRLLLEACRKLHLAPENILYIGTSYQEGYLPAVEIGMHATHLVRTEGVSTDLLYCIQRLEKNMEDRVMRKAKGIPSWMSPLPDPNEWTVRT